MIFPHKIDHYLVSYTKDTSGAKTPSYTLVTEDIKCFVQPAMAKVVDSYFQSNIIVSHSIFTENKTAYDLILFGDRLVFNGVNFQIKGKRNDCELNKIFRIDIEVEAS